MKIKQIKKIFDSLTVYDIPEGKESEYYTKEQSFELINRFKKLIIPHLVLISLLLVMMILAILEKFIGLPDWVSILIYVVTGLVFFTFIMVIVMYTKFLKLVKEISIEENK